MTNYWRRLLPVSLAGSIFVAAAPITFADSVQALASITEAAATQSRERARRQGYDNVLTEVRPLDKRLRLPQCSEPLSTLPSQSSKVLGPLNIGVRCNGEKPWTIYVRANVSAQQSVPVLVRPLPRHAIITRDDLKLLDQPIHSATNGVIFDPNQIIGMELLRPLDIGSSVKVNQLRPPKVIKRGQQVTLVASFNGLDVRIKGKALGDAAVGERVTVTNLSSGNRVEGIARKDGTVWVP